MVTSPEHEGGQIHLNAVLYPVISPEHEGGQIHLNAVLYPVISPEHEGGQIHLNAVKGVDHHKPKLTQEEDLLEQKYITESTPLHKTNHSFNAYGGPDDLTLTTMKKMW